MLKKPLLYGEKVRLTAEDAKILAKTYTRWSNNSQFWRLMDSGVTRPQSIKAVEKAFEKYLEIEPEEDSFYFNIRTLDDDQLIGDIGLDGVNWAHGEVFVGIGLGEMDYWGKGYGTDAMHVILRYAFEELNLRRVTLNVFEYNPRAIRSYEKAGFQIEGRLRGGLLREGSRWDMIYMGILKEEWQAVQKNMEK